ncbi:hypothetical protein FIV42_14955 [Persicimonas caeni]|uniref:Lipoprotein n=1 Tax=Persicimonas caeni TaxID=2292766 RepID=A0A4Y6PUR2_PERCE|nr:hypothetical protein [Persicimonas caeni]QDG51990.1 hypothetical protein FIV42_14955 [Persicimonas caeni]QED33211.1 hypothetical protein FRD00_14950 [Persicimonas caeni]
MTRLAVILSALALLTSACSDDNTQSNNTADTGAADVSDTADTAEPSDTGATDATDTAEDTSDDADDADTSDVGKDDCLQVELAQTVGEVYEDGVSVEYSVQASPQIEGETRQLSILFERYGNATYTGTFELGPGRDSNFGNCAHCLYIRGDVRERAFFADRGTLVSNADPFQRTLDVSVTDLRLVEVEVGEGRYSTPVPGGVCIEVADFSFKGTFPPSGWTCPVQSYRDGEYCNCECGAFDPDCNRQPCSDGSLSCPDEQPEPLPVLGCQQDEICEGDALAGEHRCMSECDFDARQGCADGYTCMFAGGGYTRDICSNDPLRLAPDVRPGESCPDTPFQKLCNVVDGFAEGYCGCNDVCRPLCATDADCDSGQICIIPDTTVPEPHVGFCDIPSCPDPDDGE